MATSDRLPSRKSYRAPKVPPSPKRETEGVFYLLGRSDRPRSIIFNRMPTSIKTKNRRLVPSQTRRFFAALPL
jgi:hypothetical protein